MLKTGAAEAVSPTTQYYSRGHITSLKTLGANISINKAIIPSIRQFKSKSHIQCQYCNLETKSFHLAPRLNALLMEILAPKVLTEVISLPLYNNQTTCIHFSPGYGQSKHWLDVPAHGVDVRLLVEVVAVLADVVQGGVDGRVIPAPALVRHPSVPLAASHMLRHREGGSDTWDKWS